ncbi:MAG: hypothetical protein J7578_14950 [Chitinophagaceae bacterium]|nr:hypothetical protein [Chitinophagaceae bacterium]
MKKRASILFVSAMATVTLVVLTVASCKKNGDKIRNDQPVRAAAASCDTCTYANVDTLRGVITVDRTLNCNTIYYLDGLVYVSNNKTLTIQPGTIIYGLPGNLTSNPRIPGGGLIITKGSKINAVGTESCPITFTSYRDGSGTPASGDWSGVVLLGQAPTNNGTTNIVEGVPSNPPADATYGGNIDNDNSGTLKYVVIKYAGFALSDNNEINGLTMAGVGCGTTIDYVEVFKANDDAFEWFGGTVNASHLIAVDPLDDMFDFDNAYRGHIQFALGLADQSRADQSTSNGIESDNNAGGTVTTIETRPVISNMTLIGYADSTLANSTNRGRGNHWRRNTGFMLQNSIVMGFKEGLLLDGNLSQEKYLAAYSSGKVRDSLKRNLVHAYNGTTASFVTNGPYTTAQFNTRALLVSSIDCGDTLFQENLRYTGLNSNAGILLTNPYVRSTTGFYRPQSTSPAVSTTTANVGFTSCALPGLPNPCSYSFGTVNYVGAFSSSAGSDWAVNWAIFE